MLQADNIQKDNAKVRKKNESNACHNTKDILPHRKIRSKIRHIELHIPHFRYCTLYRILILLQTLINTHRIVFI